MATPEPQKLTKTNLESALEKPSGSKGGFSFGLGQTELSLTYQTKTSDGTRKLVAFGAATTGGKAVKVGIDKIIQAIDPDADLPDFLSDLQLQFNELLLSYERTSDSGRKWAIGVDLSLVTPDISKIPLVGHLIKEASLVLADDLMLLYTFGDLNKADIDFINELVPKDKTKIALPKEAKDTTIILKKGLNIAGNIKLSPKPAVNLPAPSTPATPNTPPSDATPIWLKIQKHLGPLSIDKIGVRFIPHKLELDFLLSAGIHISDFSGSFMELSIGSAVTHLAPTVDLKGITLSYNNPEVQLAGLLLKLQGNDPQGHPYTEYVGELKLATGDDFTFLAMGSFVNSNDTLSLFAYTFIGVPIPVAPPDFVIDGFAFGGGINQGIHVPPANQLDQFPLVKEVMPGGIAGQKRRTHGKKADDDEVKAEGEDTQDEAKKKEKKLDPATEAKALTKEFTSLNQYIFPNPHSYFGAVGIKGGAVEEIDIFALLLVEMGSRLEFDLLGVASATFPVAEVGKPEEDCPVLAYLGAALKVCVAPTDGYASLLATITQASYIVGTDWKPSGGFAAYTWWKGPHNGDFVLTAGGYNPYFNPPAHYPTVTRLILVRAYIPIPVPYFLEGFAYFALCAHALMAGIEAIAHFPLPVIHASIELDIDLLIGWKPFHYDAHIGIDAKIIGPTVLGITPHVDVGADLHIWGPEFSGLATFSALGYGVLIRFGGSAPFTPQAISWSDFKGSFLADDDQICTTQVAEGLVTKVPQADKTELTVVNPKHLRIHATSKIPAKAVVIGTQSQTIDGANHHFGIAPMGLAAADVQTTHTLKVTRHHDNASVEADFEFTPIKKPAPTGLWGEATTPDLNGPRFVPDVVTGFALTPKKAAVPGATTDIKTQVLQYEHTDTLDCNWESTQAFDTIRPSSSQDQLLAALGY